MVELNTTREFHNELCIVCTAFEALFRLAGPDYSEVEYAATPALLRFRELLDAGDKIAGPDAHSDLTHGGN